MRKLKNWLNRNNGALTALSSFAMAFVVLAANSRCSYCFHQPKLPESADRFKKL